jgi:hypothetical protein
MRQAGLFNGSQEVKGSHLFIQARDRQKRVPLPLIKRKPYKEKN